MEANLLINMVKKYIETNSLEFPNSGGRMEFEVIGERRTDKFVINITRKKKSDKSASYQGRMKKDDTILMRLDVNPSAVHTNPSTGEKIIGTHLHIYDEKFEIQEAIPFDIENKDLFQLCFTFFEKFNIIVKPSISHQTSFL